MQRMNCFNVLVSFSGVERVTERATVIIANRVPLAVARLFTTVLRAFVTAFIPFRSMFAIVYAYRREYCTYFFL